ncbi:PilN domain-containing protein [Cellulomonas sp. NPDC055163]
MTALLDRRSVKGQSPVAIAPGMPQVDLTPPEVWSARALRRLQKRLVLGVGSVVVLVVLAVVAASVHAASAQSALTDAQAETTRLLTEQQKYAEVPVVLDRVDALTRAQKTGMSTEILWTPYLSAILSVLPEGVQLSSITTSVATPMAAPGMSTNPLHTPENVGTVTFVGRSTTVPNAAGWIDGLETLPGFQDAWVSSVETKEDDEVGVYYEVLSTVQLNVDIFADRFAADTEGN